MLFRSDIAVNGVRLGSVNDNSNKSLAPQHAMFELGNVIPRLVWALATARRDVPVLFSKINLKDGYWRMCVSADDAWNFAYVLPKLDENEPTVLVVPDALQMGWSESPPFFCAATETARDVAIITFQNSTEIPEQPLEHIILDSVKSKLLPNPTQLRQTKLLQLLEVYIDDFIGIIQPKNFDEL